MQRLLVAVVAPGAGQRQLGLGVEHLGAHRPLGDRPRPGVLEYHLASSLRLTGRARSATPRQQWITSTFRRYARVLTVGSPPRFREKARSRAAFRRTAARHRGCGNGLATSSRQPPDGRAMAAPRRTHGMRREAGGASDDLHARHRRPGLLELVAARLADVRPLRPAGRPLRPRGSTPRLPRRLSPTSAPPAPCRRCASTAGGARSSLWDTLAIAETLAERHPGPAGSGPPTWRRARARPHARRRDARGLRARCARPAR